MCISIFIYFSKYYSWKPSCTSFGSLCRCPNHLSLLSGICIVHMSICICLLPVTSLMSCYKIAIKYYQNFTKIIIVWNISRKTEIGSNFHNWCLVLWLFFLGNSSSNWPMQEDRFWMVHIPRHHVGFSLCFTYTFLDH